MRRGEAAIFPKPDPTSSVGALHRTSSKFVSIDVLFDLTSKNQDRIDCMLYTTDPAVDGNSQAMVTVVLEQKGYVE